MDTNALAGDDELRPSIFETARGCLEQFDNYILTVSSQPHNYHKAVDLAQKLRVWSKYSGATSRKGLSLDDRLDAVSDVKGAVLRLLLTISSQLRKVSDISHSDADILDGESEITKWLKDSTFVAEANREQHKDNPWGIADKAIDMLFELAAVIRDASHISTDVEIPATYTRDDDVYFESMAATMIRRWYPNARRTLTDQLAHALFTQRKRILYRQRHEEKLQFELPDSNSVLRPEGLDSKPLVVKPTPAALHHHGAYNRVGRTPFIAPSLTQLSKIPTHSAIMRQARAATVVTGRVQGSITEEHKNLDYPEAPTNPEDPRNVFCPYCCRRLTISQLHHWKQHIEDDLKPLICLSESCQDPLRFFSRQADWLQHMEEYHGKKWYQQVHMMTWFCDIGHHENQEFVNADDFRKHLEEHGIRNAKQSALVRHNQATGFREKGVCPLCEIAPSIEPDGNSYSLFEHIAHHLKRIALIALPVQGHLLEQAEIAQSDTQSNLDFASRSSNSVLEEFELEPLGNDSGDNGVEEDSNKLNNDDQDSTSNVSALRLSVLRLSEMLTQLSEDNRGAAVKSWTEELNRVVTTTTANMNVQILLPIPTLEGFLIDARRRYPSAQNFLLERVAMEQRRRYKKLIALKVAHLNEVNQGRCSSGSNCVAAEGKTVYFNVVVPDDQDELGARTISGPYAYAVLEEEHPVEVSLKAVLDYTKMAELCDYTFECPFCFLVKKNSTDSDWKKHIFEDLQPYNCTFEDCADPKAFKRKADWIRHENERHRELEWWVCTVGGCHHTCFRLDNFRQHLYREHGIKESLARPSIKSGRTINHDELTPENIEESKIEDQVSQLVKECRHETTKKAIDEPCRFCGDAFTSYRKLCRHVARHLEDLACPILTLVQLKEVTATPFNSAV